MVLGLSYIADIGVNFEFFMTGLEYLKKKKLEELCERHGSVNYFNHQANFKDTEEGDLEKCILYFAQLEGFQAERIKVKPNKKDNRITYIDAIGRKKTIGSVQYFPSSMQAGSADMSCTIRGRSVKLEIKIRKDWQKDNQKKYQEQIVKAGGEYWITRTFQQFYDQYYHFINFKINL